MRPLAARAAASSVLALALTAGTARADDHAVTFPTGSAPAAYAPDQLEVAAGDTVTFGGAFANHPLVWTDGDFATEDSGTSHGYAFPKPGLYRFHCAIHTTSMVGSVHVPGDALATPDFGVSPAAPRAGDTVTYTATAFTDPDGAVARYEWDLDGDGTFETSSTGGQVARAYASARTVHAALRYVDDAHETSAATTHYVVVAGGPPGPPPPPPPPAPPHGGGGAPGAVEPRADDDDPRDDLEPGRHPGVGDGAERRARWPLGLRHAGAKRRRTRERRRQPGRRRRAVPCARVRRRQGARGALGPHDGARHPDSAARADRPGPGQRPAAGRRAGDADRAAPDRRGPRAPARRPDGQGDPDRGGARRRGGARHHHEGAAYRGAPRFAVLITSAPCAMRRALRSRRS
jgi:plastocyanin